MSGKLSPIPILRSDTSPVGLSRKSIAWIDEAVSTEETKSGAGSNIKIDYSPFIPIASSTRPDSSSRPASRSSSPTNQSTAHIARVDLFPSRPRSASSRPKSAGDVFKGDVNATWSISETNNPIIDRLINELRRLLKLQQKETAAAKAKNIEMNKLLFERNEFVKVTVAALKKEESLATMLQNEIRRLKAGGPPDDFENLCAEINRLSNMVIKQEAAQRLMEEENVALTEQLQAAAFASGPLPGTPPSRVPTPTSASKAMDDPEGWLRTQLQLQESELTEVRDAPETKSGAGTGMAMDERLMLIAAKLKALVQSLIVADCTAGAAAQASVDKYVLEELLEEPEFYLSTLLQFDPRAFNAAAPNDNSPYQRTRKTANSMVDISDAVAAAVAQKDEELRTLSAVYEEKLALLSNKTQLSPEQLEALSSIDLKKEVGDLKAALEASQAQAKAKTDECQDLQLELHELDGSLADRKQEIVAIEVMLGTLEARLSEEMRTSAGLSSDLADRTATLGQANAHIASLHGSIQQKDTAFNTAAKTAAETISEHVAAIKLCENQIASLEDEKRRESLNATHALSLKTKEMNKMQAELTHSLTERDTHIAQLLNQLDEWEKKMSLFEIIKEFEGENIALKAEVLSLSSALEDSQSRLGVATHDFLFYQLLTVEREKFELKSNQLDAANTQIEELLAKNEELYRTIAIDRIENAKKISELSTDFVNKLRAAHEASEIAARKATADKCTEVTVLKGILSLLEQEALNAAVQAKDDIRVRDERISSLEETMLELDRILFAKDALILRLRAEVAEFRCAHVDRRALDRAEAESLAMSRAEDPINEVRAPRQRLKLVEEALAKAEDRAGLWERMANEFQRELQNTHTVAFEIDGNLAGGADHASRTLFMNAMKQRLFAARAVAIIDSRAITERALDELHVWAELHNMTHLDEEKALRSVQCSWAGLEALVGIQEYMDDLAEQVCESAVNLDGTVDEQMDKIEKENFKETELRRRLMILFEPGRVSVAEFRAIIALKQIMGLSVLQVEHVLDSLCQSGATLRSLSERAAQGMLDEFETQASTVLFRDLETIVTALDGPGRHLQNPEFLVHCKVLLEETHASVKLRVRYAELKACYNNAKLQSALSEARLPLNVREAVGGDIDDGLGPSPRTAETVSKLDKRMQICRDALSKELQRLSSRGGLSVGREFANTAASTPSHDGVLLRVDENLESIELQLAQCGGEWDKARLIFVKLLRGRLQHELHLRAEERRLSLRLKEADVEAHDILALAEEAATGWGREEDGSAMISKLIYDIQQKLVSSNERLKSTLHVLSTMQKAELKQLQGYMFELEDHIDALLPHNASEQVDESSYPPTTYAINAQTGEKEALSLHVLQAELGEIRALDLALDRLEHLAGSVEDVLLHQLHREMLPGLRDNLMRLHIVDLPALPDHRLLKTQVVWSVNSFPEMSALHDTAQVQAQTLSIEGMSPKRRMVSFNDPDSPMEIGQQIVALKPQSSERKSRSKKIVPTAIEEKFAQNHSAVLDKISSLQEEMVSVHIKVEGGLLEMHQKSLAVAEQHVETASLTAKHAARTESAAMQAAEAARKAEERVLALQEAVEKKTCSIM